MYPCCFARYTQKTLSHFLLNTRGLNRVQTLLSPFQKNGENGGDFYGEIVKRRSSGRTKALPYRFVRGF